MILKDFQKELRSSKSVSRNILRCWVCVVVFCSGFFSLFGFLFVCLGFFCVGLCCFCFWGIVGLFCGEDCCVVEFFVVGLVFKLGCNFEHHWSFGWCTVKFCVTDNDNFPWDKVLTCKSCWKTELNWNEGIQWRAVRWSLQAAIYVSETVAMAVTVALKSAKKFQAYHLQ